jgi:hypothetical protein
VAEAQAAPTPEPAPPTLGQLLMQSAAQKQYTNAQAKTKPPFVRVSISGKQRTPMPKSSDSTAEASAAAPPKPPKKSVSGKDSESSAVT